MRHFVLILVGLFFFSGCGGKNYMAPDLTADNLDFVAVDIGHLCAELIEKGEVLGFRGDDLSLELEKVFRSKGFSTVRFQAENSERDYPSDEVAWLTYTIDYLTKEELYVHVKVGDGIMITRLYGVTGDGLIPKEKLVGRVEL